MPEIQLTVNGKTVSANVTEDMPLLWVLRDTMGLTGTKYGCGIGQCGACTVHLNGKPARSCLIPAVSVSEIDITTIEGICKRWSARAYSAGLDRQRCGTVWLLSGRPNNVCISSLERETKTQR